MLPHRPSRNQEERGAVLVITLMLLLIASFVAVYMVAGTTQDLRMARNTQQAAISLEAAEAAIHAVLRASITADNAADPLRVIARNDTPLGDPANPNHPLRNLPGGAASIAVAVEPTALNAACPFVPEDEAVSSDMVQCNFYRITAAHTGNAARSQTSLGVMRWTPKPQQ